MKLRNYQSDALEAALTALQIKPSQPTILQAGTGKTKHLVDRMQVEGHVLFIAHPFKKTS